MKRKYHLIEHTADVGLMAYGDTLPEAFANAASGMFSIIADLRQVRAARPWQVEVSAGDLESLLFEWLNHLLYLFDVDRVLFRKFQITHLDNNTLKADCYGEKYNPARHQLKTGIKSATYHLLTVDRENNRVRVIFDV